MSAQPRPTILWVDDDVFHTSLLADVLRCEGFDILVAQDATSAKHLLISRAAEVALAIVDVMMPPGPDFETLGAVQGGYRSGLLLARWIRSTYPGIPVVGYSLDRSADVAEWFETEASGFYHKEIARWSMID